MKIEFEHFIVNESTWNTYKENGTNFVDFGFKAFSDNSYFAYNVKHFETEHKRVDELLRPNILQSVSASLNFNGEYGEPVTISEIGIDNHHKAKISVCLDDENESFTFTNVPVDDDIFQKLKAGDKITISIQFD